ncbi:MAG: ECF transporter S component [Bacillus sp. (in: Bacteria)]|nr:ECF transporter S component [Bacillus sp. (in: firmicutes)]
MNNARKVKLKPSDSTRTIVTKKKKLSVRLLVSIGMLSTIAYLLMLLNFPLPLFPSFLFIDFSDIPAMIATLIFGPIAGILVEFFKNALNYFMTGSQTGIPVGHIANFFAGISFILPTYYIYNKIKTRKGMTIALTLGTLTMAVIMSILNYYFILPAYTALLNFPDMRNLVLPAILPFNILKGGIMSFIFMLLFIRMQAWITKNTIIKSA